MLHPIANSAATEGSSVANCKEIKTMAPKKKPASAAGRTAKTSNARSSKPKRVDKRGDLAAVVDVLTKGVSAPVNLVLLTADRVQDVLLDAAKRGRITTDDAYDLAQTLVRKSREQKNEIVRELNGLVERGVDQISKPAGARTATKSSAVPAGAKATAKRAGTKSTAKRAGTGAAAAKKSTAKRPAAKRAATTARTASKPAK